MFRLKGNGDLYQPPHLCKVGDTYYGCTADPKYTYPYATNPVTVPLETDYLLDVVPKESPPALLHPVALTAQAIASRSLAYWYFQQGRTMNNSTRFQVFVPYKFESLPPGSSPDNPANPCASSNLNSYQQAVCGAVAPRHYISYGDDSPAFTQFFADHELETVTNSRHPYLLRVQDPISQPPPEGDAGDAGHGQGLSQRGASRWARGNTYANINKPGNPWSVRWNDVRQILTHYYTGVHLREASGTPLTPPDRWNALRITPATPLTLTAGLSSPFTLTVQNTGVATWTVGGGFALGYRWRRAGGQEGVEEEGAEAVPIPQVVPPGQALTLTVPVRPPAGAAGAYILIWDMRHGSQWFSRQSPSWPTQEMAAWIIPLLTDVYDDPDPFSPDGDGWQEETFLHYTLHQTATVQVVIHTIDECYLDRTLGSGLQPSGEHAVPWDGCLRRNPNPPHPCPTHLLSGCPEGWGVPRDGTYPYHLRAGPQLVTGTVTVDTTLQPSGWPMYLHDPAHTGYNPVELTLSPPLTLTWSHSGSPAAPPAVVNGLVYALFASSVNPLYALDAATGQVVSHNDDLDAWWGPTVADGLVLVAATSTLYALPAGEVSQVVWQQTPGSPLASHPVAMDGVVYVLTNDAWAYLPAGLTPADVRRLGPASLDRVVREAIGSIYALDWGGLEGEDVLWALEAETGAVRWSHPFPTGAWSVVTPAVADGQVYLIVSQSGASYLDVFDAETGAVLGQYPIPFVEGDYTFLSMANGVVYAVQTSPDPYPLVFAFDAGDGRWLWQYEDPHDDSILPPVMARGRLYVAADSYGLLALGP